MWLGVHIYNDGMEPTFKKAKTKKEITEWLINECDFGSADRNNLKWGLEIQKILLNF